MAVDQVQLFYTGNIVIVDANPDVAHVLELAAAAAGKGNCLYALFAGGFHRAHHIAGIAAGAVRPKDIARLTQRLQRTGVHAFKAVVVGQGSEDCCAVIQTYTAIAFPIPVARVAG